MSTDTVSTIRAARDTSCESDVPVCPALANAVHVERVDNSASTTTSVGEYAGASPSERRFGGTARLYGANAAQRIAALRVAVIGIGGVGSWAAEALARSGVGGLTLVDLDHIAESNINRQVHALEDQIGRAKVEAMAERIHAISQTCRVVAVDDFLTAENCARVTDGVDAVIDCIDDVPAKTGLIAHCRDRGITLIVCGGAGGRTDTTRIRVEDLAAVRNDPLLARVRTLLRKAHGFPAGATRGKSARFGVECVFVDQPPAAAPENCQAGAALACAGYGSAMHMTASLGLAAVGRLFDRVARAVAHA